MQATIQPTRGYYTAEQARAILGKSRVSFTALIKREGIQTEPNNADRRSKLYPAPDIDRLAAHAVKTSRQK